MHSREGDTLTAYLESTAAKLLVTSLEHEGVEYIFGIPGEENIHFIDALRDSSIRYILTRHEQGASFMADIYGRLTGKAGVCSATLGPRAINLLLTPQRIVHPWWPSALRWVSIAFIKMCAWLRALGRKGIVSSERKSCCRPCNGRWQTRPSRLSPARSTLLRTCA
jgi:Thiamine pyrophosphate enzyme, N-terminal TPP binding domain